LAEESAPFTKFVIPKRSEESAISRQPQIQPSPASGRARLSEGRPWGVNGGAGVPARASSKGRIRARLQKPPVLPKPRAQPRGQPKGAVQTERLRLQPLRMNRWCEQLSGGAVLQAIVPPTKFVIPTLNAMKGGICSFSPTINPTITRIGKSMAFRSLPPRSMEARASSPVQAQRGGRIRARLQPCRKGRRAQASAAGRVADPFEVLISIPQPEYRVARPWLFQEPALSVVEGAGSDTLDTTSESFRCANIPTLALRKVREERGTRGSGL